MFSMLRYNYYFIFFGRINLDRLVLGKVHTIILIEENVIAIKDFSCADKIAGKN